jgi:alpha-beta hydrolase superfamily lysophospholipase
MRTTDGIDLHVRDWPVPDGVARRGSLVLVHGLGEHCGRYDHVASELTAVGLAVRGYDHRGHGRSGGRRGGIPHADALLDDLRLVFDGLAAEDRGGPPPFVLGHSMGGAVAARAATGGWIVPRGLVLSSPALAVSVGPVQRAMALVGRRLIPDRPVPNGLPLDGLSHHAPTIAAYRADEHVHDRISARLFDAMVAHGDAARADATRLHVPTLLLVAGADRLVDAGGSRAFFAALPAGVGTLHVYDDLYHELFNEREPDRGRVFADLRGWLEARLQRISVST